MSIGYLWTDDLNDWFEFQTLYLLTYFDDQGTRHELGEVQIGQFARPEKVRRPQLTERFTLLDEQFFSPGQDVAYYNGIASRASADAPTLLRRQHSSEQAISLDSNVVADAAQV